MTEHSLEESCLVDLRMLLQENYIEAQFGVISELIFHHSTGEKWGWIQELVLRTFSVSGSVYLSSKSAQIFCFISFVNLLSPSTSDKMVFTCFGTEITAEAVTPQGASVKTDRGLRNIH